MRDDYALQGKTESIEIKVEERTAGALQEMVDHTKLSADEIVNTALKRFISTHKDFFPKKR